MYEIERLLNPDNLLVDAGLLVHKELLKKYPREPNDKDKQRALMTAAREEMEKAF